MPLDFDLIQKSTEYSGKKLDYLENTDCPDLFLVNDFLHENILEKLKQFVYIVPNKKWQRVPGSQFRKKITWEPDTVYEEVFQVFLNLTPKINKLFKKNTVFLGLTIWKDETDYLIPVHIDHPKIDIALQIYINDSTVNLATKFIYNDKIIEPKYLTNCGYLLNQSAKIPHYMTIPVPENYTRYSIYAIWSTDANKNYHK